MLLPQDYDGSDVKLCNNYQMLGRWIVRNPKNYYYCNSNICLDLVSTSIIYRVPTEIIKYLIINDTVLALV